MPDVIAASWRRAEMAGLTPTTVLTGGAPSAIDTNSALRRAAAPVLEKLQSSLQGSDFATLLVDRNARVVDLWCDGGPIATVFESIGLTVGSSVLEEHIGTNAPGTALEARSPVTVVASEHFASVLTSLSCHAEPIFHPMTGRLEGALDVSVVAPEMQALAVAVVRQAVQGIQQGLYEDKHWGEAELLRVFHAVSARSKRPVVAVADDFQLTNLAANNLLTQADFARLRVLGRKPSGGQTHHGFDIGEVAVQSWSVSGGGTVFELQLRRREPVVRPRRAECHGSMSGGHKPSASQPDTGSRKVAGTILVSGPPGSGRTREVFKMLGPSHPYLTLEAASALVDGAQKWAHRFVELVKSEAHAVCIDGVEQLPDSLVTLLVRHIDSKRLPHLVLVTDGGSSMSGPAQALCALAVRRITLTSLHSRADEIPQIVSSLLNELGADPSVHLTQGALAALANNAWPGNMRQLQAVLDAALKHRKVGAITLEDLPEEYRITLPPKRFTSLEKVEREAIIACLRRVGGNKVKAAAELGISRTTLYAKMRTLRIVEY